MIKSPDKQKMNREACWNRDGSYPGWEPSDMRLKRSKGDKKRNKKPWKKGRRPSKELFAAWN